MTMFETPEIYQGPVDPNGGFLCCGSYWRPKAGVTDPADFGEKLQMSSYIACAPDQPCLCGSGKLFQACCQSKRLWYPICPNPGLPGEAGYSLMRVQTATFTDIVGPFVRRKLMDDLRLHCTEDTSDRVFWIYEGNPGIQTPHGIMCFGDIELLHNHTLLITALSNLRMRILLSVLHEDCGQWMARPQITYKPMQFIDKRTGQPITRTPGTPASKRRRRR
ncbi:MAG TPA: SEC-C metal-binding domain-containing protein [Anaerolineae bacterium]|nr:SEC-C metal-binding domain-containing protein [Anaerolineae bacterium]